MRNDKGITLVTVIIMIIIIAIITSVSVINGTRTVKDAKESAKEQNLAAVKAAVSEISMKKGTAGVLTPANAMIYGTSVKNVLEVVDSSLDNWYVLEQEDLKEMGLEYVSDMYVVNYQDNEVYTLTDFQTSKYADNIYQGDDIKVTFDANGGTVGTTNKKVKYGEAYGILPVPTRDGYTFVGWHNEKSKNLLNPNAEYAMRYDGTIIRNYIYFDSDSNTYTSFTNNSHHIYGYDITKYISNGSTYTFSVEITAHGTDEKAHIGFDTLDTGIRKVYYKNYTTRIGDRITYTLTIPNGVTRCIVGINNDGHETGVKFANLQLEEGSIATEYEPYYITSSTTVVQPNNHTLTAVWEKNL